MRSNVVQQSQSHEWYCTASSHTPQRTGGRMLYHADRARLVARCQRRTALSQARSIVWQSHQGRQQSNHASHLQTLSYCTAMCTWRREEGKMREIQKAGIHLIFGHHISAHLASSTGCCCVEGQGVSLWKASRAHPTLYSSDLQNQTSIRSQNLAPAPFCSPRSVGSAVAQRQPRRPRLMPAEKAEASCKVLC